VSLFTFLNSPVISALEDDFNKTLVTDLPAAVGIAITILLQPLYDAALSSNVWPETAAALCVNALIVVESKSVLLSPP
jgi:hypothetical protein